MEDGPDTFISVAFISSVLTGWIVIRFSAGKAENVCMNPVPRMGCFVIYVEGMRRKIITNRGRNYGISPTPYRGMP
jgi:hypothetical protein